MSALLRKKRHRHRMKRRRRERNERRERNRRKALGKTLRASKRRTATGKVHWGSKFYKVKR